MRLCRICVLLTCLIAPAIPARAIADMVYVSNAGNSTIERFTSGGVCSVFTSTGTVTPAGLTLDASGNLYVIGNNGYYTHIQQYTPTGGETKDSIVLGPTMSPPYGLTIDKSGNLYFPAGNYVWLFTSSGASTAFAAGDYYPVGIALNSSGNVYFTDQGRVPTAIRVATPYTGGNGTPTVTTFTTTGLNNPNGLAFDSSGNLYVANAGNNTIEEFTPGGVASVFASTGLDDPVGLAFDSSGNLYAVNSGNNTIEMFTPDGVGSVFADTGLDDPQWIAIEPASVPEPSSLFLLGIAGIIIYCSQQLARWRRSPVALL